MKVKEINQLVDKDQFLNELTNSIKKNLSEDIEKVEDTIKQQNKQLQEDIQALTEQVKELEEQQNKSFWNKSKN